MALDAQLAATAVRRLVAPVAAAVALLALQPSGATAITPFGGLVQPAGPGGCVRQGGNEPCARGTALRAPTSVAVAPDGRDVYVTSFAGDAVAVLRRDPGSGALTQGSGRAACLSEGAAGGCTPARALGGASGIAVSPDGRNVYVAAAITSSVATFSRDPQSGALSQLPESAGCVSQGGAGGCSPANGMRSASSVTVSPDGRNVYVAAPESDAVAVLARDPGTGALSQLADPTGCVSEGGRGTCTVANGLRGAASATVSPDGAHVYAAGFNNNAVVLLARDQSTGALSPLTAVAGCISQRGADGCAPGRGLGAPSSVAVSPNGRLTLVASFNSNAVAVFSRDAASGGLTQLPGRGGCISQTGGDGCTIGKGLNGASEVAMSPDGRSAYAASSRSGAVAAFAVDRRSGGLVQLAEAAACHSKLLGEGCRTARGLGSALSVAVSPEGRHAYAVSFDTDALAVFGRELRDRPPTRVRLSSVAGRCTSSDFTARVAVDPASRAVRVRVLLDRRTILQTRSNRFGVRIRARSLRPGPHSIDVLATDREGDTVERTALFSRCAPARRPSTARGRP